MSETSLFVSTLTWEPGVCVALFAVMPRLISRSSAALTGEMTASAAPGLEDWKALDRVDATAERRDLQVARVP